MTIAAAQLGVFFTTGILGQTEPKERAKADTKKKDGDKKDGFQAVETPATAPKLTKEEIIDKLVVKRNNRVSDEYLSSLKKILGDIPDVILKDLHKNGWTIEVCNSIPEGAARIYRKGKRIEIPEYTSPEGKEKMSEKYKDTVDDSVREIIGLAVDKRLGEMYTDEFKAKDNGIGDESPINQEAIKDIGFSASQIYLNGIHLQETKDYTFDGKKPPEGVENYLHPQTAFAQSFNILTGKDKAVDKKLFEENFPNTHKLIKKVLERYYGLKFE